MKKILLITLLFFCTFVHSQISFQKGYFISNEGKRTECYIKNLDWKNTPTDFKYKMELDDAEFKAENITSTLEFGIDNESTYKRFTLKIDRSSDDLKKITRNPSPNWTEETLFLKVLIDGEASLYSYNDELINKFFYATKTIPIEQLVYIKYLKSDRNEGAERISENNQYKQQLLVNVTSLNISEKDIHNLSYKKASLTDYFEKYNNVKSVSASKEETKAARSQFSIKITSGVSVVSTLAEGFYNSNLNVTLDNKIVFKLGAEAEYVLPYNKNKWSVFINPTYQKYQDEKDYTISSGFIANPEKLYNIKINYNSIQLPIGVRHYMFLNEISKIFISVFYSIDVAGKTNIEYKNKTGTNSSSSLESRSPNNLGLGLGYNFKNKFTAELRLNARKELMNYLYYSAKYTSLDFIISYRIFNTK